MPYGLQRLIATGLLIPALPIIAILAVAVRLGSPGPALFRAVRITEGREFVLLKLRSMTVTQPAEGPRITAASDMRVTRVGRLLRRAKLDELPQLWNVVRGEMALVGPRPEDPAYVATAPPEYRHVFAARAGITSPAAIQFRDEEAMLDEAARAIAASDGRDLPAPEDFERAYVRMILPRKLALDDHYLRSRSARGDLAILARTVGAALRRESNERR